MMPNVIPMFPEPLTPDDCDLRAFAFMPLDVQRLRRSRSWLAAKRQPELGFYMMNLWSAAWHEVPAGSLEDNDDVLADRAMCEVRRWQKVKSAVMQGWTKCKDGRLYHRIVAEKATEAWRTRLVHRKRTEAARAAAAARRRGDRRPPQTADTSVTDLPLKREERVESREKKESKSSVAKATDEPVPVRRQKPQQVPETAKDQLWREGVPTLRDITGLADKPARSLLGKLLRDLGGDCAATFRLITEAADSRPANVVEWLSAAAHNRRRRRSRVTLIEEQLGIAGMELPP